MKKLIVFRHGAYDEKTGRLDEDGREWLVRVAERVKPHLEGRVRILSSTAPRAVDSAEVLAAQLGLEGVEQHLVLWSDNEHRMNLPGVGTLVFQCSFDVEVLILVTHLEYAESFPTYFAEEMLHSDIEPYQVSYGCARVIDCEERTEIAYLS